MQYLLLIHDDEQNWLDLTGRGAARRRRAVPRPDRRARGARRVRRQQPACSDSRAAATVRVRDREDVVVTDGPFAETKEQLGGYYLIDVETLDEALEWAARIPTARRGSVEVRPILPIPTRPA